MSSSTPTTGGPLRRPRPADPGPDRGKTYRYAWAKELATVRRRGAAGGWYAIARWEGPNARLEAGRVVCRLRMRFKAHALPFRVCVRTDQPAPGGPVTAVVYAAFTGGAPPDDAALPAPRGRFGAAAKRKATDGD